MPLQLCATRKPIEHRRAVALKSAKAHGILAACEAMETAFCTSLGLAHKRGLQRCKPAIPKRRSQA